MGWVEIVRGGEDIYKLSAAECQTLTQVWTTLLQ